jgi:phosphoribosylformylglycinamidine synthase subunit PurQ / glutaminase
MMPHPERTDAGDAIFLSMRDYIAEGFHLKVQPMSYQTRFEAINPYQAPLNSQAFIVELIITDNHAMSLENTLNHSFVTPQGFKIQRYLHWELQGVSSDVLEKIKKTGILFNDRKEKMISIDSLKSNHSPIFLVRAKEDMEGLQKKQLLKNHFDLSVDTIHYSVLWRIEGEVDLQSIINSNILFNPYAHDYYTF